MTRGPRPRTAESLVRNATTVRTRPRTDPAVEVREAEDSAVTSPRPRARERPVPAARHRRTLTVVAASGSGASPPGQACARRAELRAEGDGPAITIVRYRPRGAPRTRRHPSARVFSRRLGRVHRSCEYPSPECRAAPGTDGRSRNQRETSGLAVGRGEGAHRTPVGARSAWCGNATPMTPSSGSGVSYTGNTSGAPVFVSRPCALALLT